MYALAARDLFKAADIQAKVKVFQEFIKNKLVAKRPEYAVFEPGFAELKYSSQMSKQKPFVRYILLKIYQANSKGLPIAQEKVTIEHLSPEHPAKSMGLAPEQVASIGNLILVDQSLNEKLANKDFHEKIKILKDAQVWVDPIILGAKNWGPDEIEKRTRLLAKEAYEQIWSF
jgi:hypothetical protein